MENQKKPLLIRPYRTPKTNPNKNCCPKSGFGSGSQSGSGSGSGLGLGLGMGLVLVWSGLGPVLFGGT